MESLNQRIARLVAALVVGVSSGPALATIYNFDMTGLSPAPPYDSVIISYTQTGSTSNTCAIFGGLNLTGDLVSGCSTLGDFSFEFTGPPILLDGIFSMSIITDGSFSVPTAVGVSGAVRTDPLVGVVPAAVPEPATLALIGLGLAGVAFARRRAQ